MPVQGPLSHGVVSAGLLFPQPSRGRLLTWLVMHTTVRVLTPAPHSAEHCKTEGGHAWSPCGFCGYFQMMPRTCCPPDSRDSCQPLSHMTHFHNRTSLPYLSLLPSTVSVTRGQMQFVWVIWENSRNNSSILSSHNQTILLDLRSSILPNALFWTESAWQQFPGPMRALAHGSFLDALPFTRKHRNP